MRDFAPCIRHEPSATLVTTHEGVSCTFFDCAKSTNDDNSSVSSARQSCALRTFCPLYLATRSSYTRMVRHVSRTTSKYPQSVGDLDGYSNESRPREPRHRSDNSALFGLVRDSSMRRGRPKQLTGRRKWQTRTFQEGLDETSRERPPQMRRTLSN